MRSLLLIFGFLVAVSGQAAVSFQASVTIYNDPAVLGTMLGTMYYDANAQMMRTDYQVGGGSVIEVIDYSKKLRYLYCTSCHAETWTTAMPQYHNGNSAGDSATINGVSCAHYTIAGNEVTDIWATGTTICRAKWSNGKIVDFTAVATIDPNAFTVINNWGCPAPVCNKEIDFVLVFDESGSISPPNFVKEVQFGTSFAQSYNFGPTAVGMALVQFSTAARLTIHMTYSQSSFLNAMSKVYQNAGNTCIGCGLQLAYDEFINYGRWHTAGVAYVIIMLTDGMNNVGLNQFDSIVSQVKNAGMIIFSIGVGPYVNPPELVALASVIPGVTTTYPQIPSFSALAGVLNTLVTATCQAIPSSPCGTGCNGFCSCGGVCVCPSSCQDNNMCTTKSCTPNINGNGCVYTPVTCSNGNLCQTGTCNPTSGCSYTALTCAAQDACHTPGCDPNVGCTYTPINCNQGNPCYADSCDPTLGCQHVKLPPGSCNMCINVTCPKINCQNNVCNPMNGLCEATPINCDDNNMCTDDSCNPTTGACQYARHNCSSGNLCNIDTCDPKLGCMHTPVNVSSYCNDFTVCTNDTCVPSIGCVHTNITCNDGNL